MAEPLPRDPTQSKRKPRTRGAARAAARMERQRKKQEEAERQLDDTTVDGYKGPESGFTPPADAKKKVGRPKGSKNKKDPTESSADDLEAVKSKFDRTDALAGLGDGTQIELLVPPPKNHQGRVPKAQDRRKLREAKLTTMPSSERQPDA